MEGNFLGSLRMWRVAEGLWVHRGVRMSEKVCATCLWAYLVHTRVCVCMCVCLNSHACLPVGV